MATILVIEDNPANMKLAVLLLEQSGHDVLQASDAASGLALARQRLPALVLMDIQLPGMDGLSATRELKADPHTAGIKVIALTAFAMRGDKERILDSGCDAYLAKPIRYQEFLELVRAMLGAAQADEPPVAAGSAMGKQS